jgi:hypothetical protein
MSLREEHNADGIRCDAHGCHAIFEFDLMSSLDAILDYLPSAGPRAGWSMWVGRGGQRHYCPLHGPKPGHSMRRSWGDEGLRPSPEQQETP